MMSGKVNNRVLFRVIISIWDPRSYMVLYKLTLFTFQKFFNHQSIQGHVSAWLPMMFKSKQAPLQIKEQIYKILIVDCTVHYTCQFFHETVFAF